MKHRLFLSAIFAVLSAGALGQSTDGRIDFSVGSTSIKDALAKLSPVAGVSLQVAANIATEPILIHVTDRSVKDIMDQIATVLDAEWKPEGQGFRLVRSARHEQAIRQRAIKDRATRIAPSLERFKAEIEKHGAFDAKKAKTAAEAIAKRNAEVTEQMSGAGGGAAVRVLGAPGTQGETPASLALKRLLMALGAQELASIERGTRTVYALSPTAMQKLMPRGAQEIFRQFAQEHDLFVRAMQDMPKETTPNVPVFVDDASQAQFLNGQVHEAHLVIQRFTAGFITAELNIADRNGRFVGTAQAAINLAASTAPQLALPATEEPIRFSERAIEHARLLMSAEEGSGSGVIVRATGNRTMVMVEGRPMGAGGPAEPKPVVTEEWRRIFADPLSHDPLSFAASEAFLGAAKVGNLDVVATLPDMAVLVFARRAAEPMTLAQLVSGASTEMNLAFELKDGWLTANAKDGIDARLSRFDRKAAQTMFASMKQEGRLSLNAIAAFLLTKPHGFGSNLIVRQVGVVDLAARSAFVTAYRNPLPYQLYGSLPTGARQALSSEYGLPYMQLNPFQRDLVHKMYFHDGEGPERQRPPDPNAPAEVRRSQFVNANGMMFRMGGAALLDDERTEYMPQGVPNASVLYLRANEEQAVFGSSQGSEDGRYYTAQELGIMLNMQQNMQVASNFQPPKLESFRMGAVTRIELIIETPRLARLVHWMDDARHDRKVRTYTELPEDFRRKAESAAEQVNRRMPPPPPPAP